MRFLVSGLLLLGLISITNLLPQKSIYESDSICTDISVFFEKTLEKHVSALEGNKKPFQEYQNASFKTLLYELDPLRVAFMQEEVDELLGDSDIFQNDKSCFDSFQAISKFRIGVTRFKKIITSLKDTEFKSFLADEKLLRKFVDERSKINTWPNSKKELKANAIWAVLTAYEDILENVDSKEEALAVAKRVIERQSDINQINDLTSAKDEIIKSLVYVLDAHSQYLKTDEFRNIMQSLVSSFVGVGIVVAEVRQGFKVVEVIEGGPIYKQKALKSGDIITKVNGLEVEGVSRKVLSDLLSGPTKSPVFLTYARGIQNPRNVQEVVVFRGPVRSEGASIESHLIPYKNKKIGFIKLPHFYTGIGDKLGISKDIEHSIHKLMDQGVEGIVLDLRGNGGGVLKEVVHTAGLFMTSAPVTIEMGTVGQGVYVHADKDGVSLFDGPLVVLVDQKSASASEILAGSLQSYNRAIVVGSPQTYGKGTIQEVGAVESVVGLKQQEAGIKLTVGYYYLPNGESVQSEGVKSDVVFKELKKLDKDYLERSLPFALKRPKSIDFNNPEEQKWVDDKYKEDMLGYLRAQERARDLVPFRVAQAAKIDKAKNKAINVAADIIDYTFEKPSGRLANTISR